MKNANDKLFNFRPAFFAAVFLCFGIVFAYLRSFFGVSVWWLAVCLPLAVAPFCFCRSRRYALKIAQALFLLFISFAIGHSAFLLNVQSYADCGVYNAQTEMIGKVVQIERFDGYARLILEDPYIGKMQEEGRLVAYMPASFCKNVRLSDKVLLLGHVETDVDCFGEYGFRAQDIRERVRYSVSQVDSCIVVGYETDVFLAMRQRMKTVTCAGMDDEAAAVTLAVLTGDTSGIDRGLLTNIRMGGIAHVFAVSGLHIGSLYAFCLLLMQKTKLKNAPAPVRFFLTAAILIFYTGVCGFSSSSLRATVICLVAYAAKALGLETDLLDSLGVAAIVILLLSPTALFEVGFQLSFAACLGLALLSRPIGKTLDRGCDIVKKVWIRLWRLENKARPNPKRKDEDMPEGVGARIRRACVSFLGASLAAQIATAPILLNAFGYLSGWALLLNCLFVPLISGLFATLLLFVAVACVLPTAFSTVILYLPSVVWSALLLLFYAVDFSTFVFTGVKISGVGSLYYYSGWQFLSDKWNISKKEKTVYALACFLTFVITVYALNV